MDKTLRTLFDFQRFAGNSRLAELIEESERRGIRELTMEELGMVNAAGQNTEAVVKEDERIAEFGRCR